MKYYSENLRKFFDSADECAKADEEYTKQQAEEKKRKEELAETRRTRAKEVEEALNRVQEAKENYNKLLTEFCKDYGTFHYSVDKAHFKNDLFSAFLDLF